VGIKLLIFFLRGNRLPLVLPSFHRGALLQEYVIALFLLWSAHLGLQRGTLLFISCRRQNFLEYSRGVSFGGNSRLLLPIGGAPPAAPTGIEEEPIVSTVKKVLVPTQ
jgi:hypothetical protein